MRRLIAIGVSAALLAAACGTSEGDDAAADTTSVPIQTTVAAETTAAPETTTTTPAATTTEPAATTTEPPATTTTTPGIPTSPVVPGEDEEVDAIVEAYAIVFDSATTYEDKVPYLVEPDGLEETVAKYMETGDSFGGVTLEASEVGIDGDDARVIYDFLFGGNPTYPDQEGDAVRTDAGWQITREMFCSIMTSARVGCP